MLANIYAPNQGQATLLTSILCKLREFQEGSLILGGELYITLDPLMDNLTGKSQISYLRLNRLKRLLHSLQLVAVWCILHPLDKDFTCYSASYNMYSRIDYFLISHRMLYWVPWSVIGVQMWSDPHYIFQ